MSNILSYFIVSTVLGGWYFFKSRGERRLGGSTINKIIDQTYKKWYVKNKNLLNKNSVKIPEINRLIYELKIELRDKGIEIEHVKGYVENINKRETNSKIGIKDIFIGILSVITTNSYIQKNSDEIIKWIKNLFNNEDNFRVLVDISYIIILFWGITSLIIVSYLLSDLNNASRNNQRFFVFEELVKIWDYKTEDRELEVGEVLEKNKIYTNYRSTESAFDTIFKLSVGDSVSRNSNRFVEFVIDRKDNLLKKIMQLYTFLLVFIITTLMLIIIAIIYVIYIRGCYDGVHWSLKMFYTALMLLVIVPVCFVWFLLYNSQIGVYSKKGKSFIKKNIELYVRELKGVNYVQILLHLSAALTIIYFMWKEIYELSKSIIASILISLPIVVIVFIGLVCGTRFSTEDDNKNERKDVKY